MATPEIERDLQRLEVELKRLESEYNMFFAGRLPRPPWETRKRVETIVRQYGRASLGTYGDQFRFQALQSRYATFADLWDRGLRAREEGRPGPFARKPPAAPEAPAAPKDRIVHVTSFQDPVREIDKLTDLYESLTDARRDVGEDQVPFHKFADLVAKQVATFRRKGSVEVAFRVAVKDGKVSFTARALGGTE